MPWSKGFKTEVEFGGMHRIFTSDMTQKSS